ncbi:hypothetical protein E2R51_06765 [Jeotgalibacillus sp. S-D1]|uniref:DUF5342 family protein n=1 Tax=Jeotgalibacillus sp. S-D1 TaxID=2552189 RepID=UPI00105AAA50|nr:DUF5342 family protein [Jeotgalibacillus sp. S-D1]TDL35406.1 hypothetical protein E2R51_06765 [Jeotgalibacillus sp. S-D1]
MIQHFHYQSMFENKQLPGWLISFTYEGQRISGIYHKTGNIEWTSPPLFRDQEAEENVKKQLHDLMLYHVYDQA